MKDRLKSFKGFLILLIVFIAVLLYGNNVYADFDYGDAALKTQAAYMSDEFLQSARSHLGEKAVQTKESTFWALSTKYSNLTCWHANSSTYTEDTSLYGIVDINYDGLHPQVARLYYYDFNDKTNNKEVWKSNDEFVYDLAYIGYFMGRSGYDPGTYYAYYGYDRIRCNHIYATILYILFATLYVLYCT